MTSYFKPFQFQLVALNPGLSRVARGKGARGRGGVVQVEICVDSAYGFSS